MTSANAPNLVLLHLISCFIRQELPQMLNLKGILLLADLSGGRQQAIFVVVNTLT